MPAVESTGVVAEKAFIASFVPSRDKTEDAEALREISRLASDAGARVVGGLVQRRAKPDPGTFFGTGKVQEIGEKAKEVEADLVIVDNDLTPAQIRNLEKILELKVIDRTELILDIFASRASTAQAQLQVELAQLQYTMPRLRRMWTHLSRYEGGLGIKGPGEKQIETDRRMAKHRVLELTRKIREIDAVQRSHVEARREAFKVSIVGYTNAGKSSLMNRLTGAGVSVRDRLFETLDTRTHVWKFEGGRQVLLSDTVGFIRKLPHHLVASFKATLLETVEADLLLHVVDVSAPDAPEQMAAVVKVLQDLKAAAPVLAVFNKMDLPHDRIQLQGMLAGNPEHVLVSAATGEGVEALQKKVAGRLESDQVEVDLELPIGDGALAAAVARRGRIISADYTEDRVCLKVVLAREDVDRVRAMAAQGGIGPSPAARPKRRKRKEEDQG